MRIKNHRHIMLALLRHQGGVLTINKDDRALRDVWLVLSRIAEQRQGVAVVQEDDQRVTYRLAEEEGNTPSA